MKSKEELKDFRNKTTQELTKQLNLEYENLRNLHFSLKFRKLKNSNSLSDVKKKISRIWTILGEKLNKR